MLRSRVFKGAALAAMMLVPMVAYAGVNGAAGTIRSVTINEPNSDNYASEHGSIIVEESAQTRKYQWGGAACSGRLVRRCWSAPWKTVTASRSSPATRRPWEPFAVWLAFASSGSPRRRSAS